MERRQAKPLDHYIILDELGRDRCERVYRAISRADGRPVVVRVVHVGAPRISREQAAPVRAWFRRRLEMAARPRHAGLATVLEVGSAGPLDWIVTELVAGETLRQLLDSGRPLTPTAAARIGMAVADALAAAHREGLAHGRLTLSNVVMGPGGVKVLDLGVPRPETVWTRLSGETPEDSFDDGRRDDVSALCELICAILAQTGSTDDSAEQRSVRGSVERVCAELMQRDDISANDVREALGAAVRAAKTRAHPLEQVPARTTVDVGAMPGLVFLPPESPSFVTGLRRWAPRVAAAITVVGAALVVGAGQKTTQARTVGDLTADVGDPNPAPAPQRPAFASVNPVLVMLRPDSTVPNDLAVADTPTALVVADVDASADTVEHADTVERESVASPKPRSSHRSTAAAPSFTPVVVASPSGVWIQREDDGLILGMDSVDVERSGNRPVTLSFHRAGYVSERRTLRDDPLRVRLRPDSAFVSFFANVRAEVYVEANGRSRRLGTTDLRNVVLPTGVQTFRFRVPDQPDWVVQRDIPVAGGRYQLTKLDFATRGSLTVKVAGCPHVWLDGESVRVPATFRDLPPTRHIVRVAYPDGYVVTDSVDVVAGRTVSRSYEPRDPLYACGSHAVATGR